MTRRGALTAGLVLSAPLAFLGLVLLPVGLLLQIGTQSSLQVSNGTDRTLWVTPLGTHRQDGRTAVLRQAISGLVPLPALRGADLRIEPGASRTIVYKPGDYRASGLVVRDASGDARRLAARELRIERFAELPPAPPEQAALASSSPQLLPWLVLLAGVLGVAAFFQLRRLRRRLDKQGQP